MRVCTASVTERVRGVDTTKTCKEAQMERALILISAVLCTYAGAVLLYQTYLYNFTDYLEKRKVTDDPNKEI